MTPQPTTPRELAPRGSFSLLLDVVRVVASLLVVFGHCRSWLIQGFADIAAPTLVDRTFYFFAFGHQAVVVFFVLSGWLVGGQVLLRVQSARFDVREYATQRATRIAIVLVPALVLGLLIHLLFSWLGESLPTGESLGAAVGTELFPTDSWTQFGPLTFIGNIFGLMTIWVPCYGGNSALWSLSHEMIFYALVPFVAWGFFAVKTRSLSWCAGLSLVLFSIVLAALPAEYRVTFLHWSSGAFMGYWACITSVRFRPGLPLVVIAWLSFFAALVAARMALLSPLMSDMTVGFVFLGVLLVHHRRADSVQRESTALALLVDSSFSLYVTHLALLPVLAWLALDGARLSAGAAGYVVVIGATLACTLFAMGFAQFTEKRTGWVRARLAFSARRA